MLVSKKRCRTTWHDLCSCSAHACEDAVDLKNGMWLTIDLGGRLLEGVVKGRWQVGIVARPNGAF